MKRVELLEEIVKKQEKQIRLLTDFIKLVDESETIKNSFLPYCSIKDKLRRNNIEITDLKSQLAKAGEENKSSHELQNERMRIWFQKRTGLIDAMLCTHMKKIDEMLSIDPVE